MLPDMKTADCKKQSEITENDEKNHNNSSNTVNTDYEKLFKAEKAKNGTLNQMMRIRNTHISEMSRSLELLNTEIKSLKESNSDFKITNLQLTENNRDLNAKLSRLQNTINNLQSALREQATKVLDDMFLGIKK